MSSSDETRIAHAVAREFAAIINVDVVGADGLHLRHEDGQSGMIAADDLLEGRLRVVDRRAGEVSEYEHLEALVRAGWSSVA